MTTGGLIDTSSPIRQLSTTATENLTSRYYKVENFGFLRLTSNEKFAQTWYPTPNDIVPAGWFSLDISNASFGDFNGDSLLDVVVQPMLNPHVVPHVTEIHPLLLIQNANGGFYDQTQAVDKSNFPNKHFLYRIGVADFDSDGKDDIALSAMGSVNRTSTIAYSTYDAPLVVFGSSTLIYQWRDSYENFSVRNDSTQPWIFGYSYGHSMAVGDFNGDDHPDWFSNWYVFYTKQESSFGAELIYPNSLAKNQQIPWDNKWAWPLVNASASADFNEDGFDDLIYSTMPSSDPNLNGGDLMLIMGSKSGLLDGSKVIPIPRSNDIPDNIGTNSIVSTDINGDSHADFIFMEHFWTTDAGDSTYYYSKAKLRAFLGDGKGNLIENKGVIVDPYAGHRHGEGNIHVIDLNGDGWKDLVLTGYQVNLKDIWASGSSDFDYSTVFLNSNGALRYVDSQNLAFVQPYQFSGDESLKKYATKGVSKLIPVDIGNDGMVDFVGFVETQLRQWPQIEQRSTYAYISKAIAPLGRDQKNESLNGTKGNDKIWGFDGRDQIYGDSGNDALDGGSEIDMAVYSGNRTGYSTSKTEKNLQVADKNSSDGIDTLTNIERLKFSDVSVAFDLDGNAGKVAKLLGAVFGKAALTNKQYVGVGLSFLDKGMSYQDLAALAVSVTKKTASTDICNLLWTNVFNKAPTASDIAPFEQMLDSGEISIGALTALAADTSYNTTNIDLVGLSRTGLEYM